MGYTHYFRQARNLTNDEWQALKERVSFAFINLPKTIDKSVSDYYADKPLIIADGYGEQRFGLPSQIFIDRELAEPSQLLIDKVNSKFTEAIFFNGYSVGDEDFCHDSFALLKGGHSGKGLEFHCCKTARKPYDFFVMSVLLLVNDVAPGAYVITSDGNSTEWQFAQRWLKKLFGHTFYLPWGKKISESRCELPESYDADMLSYLAVTAVSEGVKKAEKAKDELAQFHNPSPADVSAYF